MKIITIGLGLIGGSLSLESRRIWSKARCLGIDNDPKHIQEAVKLGIINAEIPWEGLSEADIVFVAVPVDSMVKMLPKVLDIVPPKAMVIEVGSTKVSICRVVEKHPKRRQLITAHPIAGTEFSGPKAAHLGLFKGAVNIICNREYTAPEMLDKAERFFVEKLNMQLRYLDAGSHDVHIAYVSHLSHVSAFMLGKTVIQKEKDEDRIFSMAGSGFRSTVRLAKSSPKTWRAIFEENRDNVVNSLEEYIENLQYFCTLMKQNNFDAIHDQMEQTNRIRDIVDHR